MTAPEVSVVLTTYNRSALVSRAIESVLNQTFTDFELIVVDDFSTDDTPDVVSVYEDDDRVDYVRHDRNRHLSASRNTGIERASGEFVAFLDDDDEWLPTKLEKQVRELRRSAQTVGLVYCWMDYYDGETVVEERHPSYEGDIFSEALVGQPIGNGSTLLVRREVFEEVGVFDESLTRGIDGDFIRRLARDYHVKHVPEVLVRYHIGHEEQRITRRDEAGIENAIEGQKLKLRKFEAELDARPSAKARILSKIGWRYLQLYDTKNAAKHFSRAWRASPATPTIYRYIAQGCFDMVRQPVQRWFSS